MKSELQQANDWLKNEIKKDQLDIELSKKQYAKEIKSIDKISIVKELKNNTPSIFKKFLYILGYGRKKSKKR
jgi:hypothetical protein